jgi:predicted DsbA family dithiol-disulfide isomerase
MKVSPATVTMATKTVDVTITSDLMCPWCYVGLKKLQEASKVANVKPNIVWKPFLLRPGIPDEGMPKGGTPDSRVPYHLKKAGISARINFTGLTNRIPNTALFHATMKCLQDCQFDSEDVTAFQEATFMEYFTLGVFPDKKGLLVASKKVGNPDVLATVERLFDDDEQLSRLRSEVAREANEASRRGISGVPSFAFGEESVPAFSGAQPTEVFVRYLKKYAKD